MATSMTTIRLQQQKQQPWQQHWQQQQHLLQQQQWKLQMLLLLLLLLLLISVFLFVLMRTKKFSKVTLTTRNGLLTKIYLNFFSSLKWAKFFQEKSSKKKFMADFDSFPSSLLFWAKVVRKNRKLRGNSSNGKSSKIICLNTVSLNVKWSNMKNSNGISSNDKILTGIS